MFIGFALLGFVAAIAPLLPFTFIDYDTIAGLGARANLSSALATSIAIILAIIATFLLVKVESTEFKAIERVKADTIQLASCLKTIYQLQNLDDNSSETTKPYEQQVTEFLLSTSAFAFDCWITQKDNQDWKDFSIDLLFISTGRDQGNLKTFGAIQLLESLLEKDILDIVKNLNDTNTAMETFKKSNTKTPLHSATKIMFQAHKEEKYRLPDLLIPTKSVLEKSINANPEHIEANAKRLLLAFYNDDKVWISNNLDTEIKLNNGNELNTTIKSMSFNNVEAPILNSLANDLYVHLMDLKTPHIDYSGFYERFERQIPQKEYFRIMHDYFKSYLSENSQLDIGDNARLNRMKGLLLNLYLESFNHASELNSDVTPSEIQSTLAKYFPDEFKNNDASIEIIKKKYLKVLSQDGCKEEGLSIDFKELLKSLKLHGLIHKPNIKTLQIINKSRYKDGFASLAFSEVLRTKEYLSLDEKISIIKHLYMISGHAKFVSLDTLIYEGYKISIKNKDEQYISNEDVSAMKFSKLMKFHLKALNNDSAKSAAVG